MDYEYIKIIDTVENFREKYYFLFKLIMDKYEVDFDSEDEEVEELTEKLENYELGIYRLLKQLNLKYHKQYELLVTMMYHDECLILNDKDSEYKKDNIELLKELKGKIKTKQDLFKLVDNDFTYVHDLITFFCDFCELEYFDKRKLIIDSKTLNPYLQKIYNLNFIDVLYYTKKFNVADLIVMYKDLKHLQRIGIKYNLLNEVTAKVQDLNATDLDNAYELANSLINISYKYLLYDAGHNNMNGQKEKIFELINDKKQELVFDFILNDQKLLKQVLAYVYGDLFTYDYFFKELVADYYNLKDNSEFIKKFKITSKKS